MLVIKDNDRNFLLEIVADAISQAAQTLKDDPKERTRWVNAIGKGVQLLDERADFITYLPEDKSLVIWSSSYEVYAANGVCQCQAYTNGIARRNKPYPCKHRALARIIRLYFELQEKPIGQNESSAPDSGVPPVLSNVAPAARRSDRDEMNNAPYLKTGTGQKPEKYGNIRI